MEEDKEEDIGYVGNSSAQPGPCHTNIDINNAEFWVSALFGNGPAGSQILTLSQ